MNNMSTTEITVPLQRLSGSIILRLQKNFVNNSLTFEVSGWYDDYFDSWYDKPWLVGSNTGIILKLQGDK